VRLNTDNKGGMPVAMNDISKLADRIAPFGWHSSFFFRPRHRRADAGIHRPDGAMSIATSPISRRGTGSRRPAQALLGSARGNTC